MEEQIERLRKDYIENENKLRKQYDDECRLLDENYEKEIVMEKNYLENCLEIDINKLKEEIENKINLLNKNRYETINKNEQNINDNDNHNEQLRLELEKNIEMELNNDRLLFEQQCNERKKRFNEQMKLLSSKNNQKRIDWLKQEIIPLINAQMAIKITDETILEQRYNLKIIRNAIKSGHSWALYRAQYNNNKNIICRIIVMTKVPNDIRMNVDHSTKCYRFLCEKQINEIQCYFVKLFEIFLSEQKIYIILDEYEPITLLSLIQQQQQQQQQHHKHKYKLITNNKLLELYNENNIKLWLKQLCMALLFIHRYAIANLNIRIDNILINMKKNNSINLYDFNRTICYFNLDQEKFIKCKRITITSTNHLNYYEHLPYECFVNDEFDPYYVDVWSYGLLSYELLTLTNPRKLSISTSSISTASLSPTSTSKLPLTTTSTSPSSLTINKDKTKISRTKTATPSSIRSNLKKLLFEKNLNFNNYEKIENLSLRKLLQSILDHSIDIYCRPTFDEILSNKYFS